MSTTNSISIGFRKVAVCNGRMYDPSRANSGDRGQCRYCGSMRGEGDCKPTTCLACGVTQCMGNGLGRGTCAYCYGGLLPGWSGTDRPCAYKGCDKRAVYNGTPKHYACGFHINKHAAIVASVEAAASAFLTLQEA